MFELVGGMLVLTIMIVLSGLKVVKEYDRLVIFRLGKIVDIKGAGLQLVIPILDRAQIVDMRMTTLPIQLVEDCTHDGFAAKVSALVMFQITDPKKAVLKVDDAENATIELAQAVLRNTIRQYNLVSLLSERRRLSNSMKSTLNKQTRDWGVLVSIVELKEVKISRESRRLMARLKLPAQAEQVGEYLFSEQLYSEPGLKQAFNASPGELIAKLQQLAGTDIELREPALSTESDDQR